MLTQERALELLEYNSLTGVLLWRETRCGTAIKGSIAGFKRINKNGYAHWDIGVAGIDTVAARVIWLMQTGSWPKFIDHINGDSLDNRWVNLRSVSRTTNNRNVARRKTNTSGSTGVCWDSTRKKWMARIGTKHIGRYDDMDKAIAARKRACIENGYHENHGR